MAASIARLTPSLKDRALAFLDPGFIAAAASELRLEWKNTPLALPNLVACFAQ